MEKANAKDSLGAQVTRGASFVEGANAEGVYTAVCRDANGNIKWTDEIKNVVTTEGKNTALTHFLKGSTYTAANFMGLISAVGYSTTPAAGNTATNITTSGATNGWNEVTTGIVAARQAPTFGTAGSGSLATSSNVSFSIVGTDTIKGCFLLIKSAAGVSPTSANGNTSGALYSAGLFSGGDKAVGSGDTLTVSYTASL